MVNLEEAKKTKQSGIPDCFLLYANCFYFLFIALPPAERLLNRCRRNYQIPARLNPPQFAPFLFLLRWESKFRLSRYRIFGGRTKQEPQLPQHGEKPFMFRFLSRMMSLCKLKELIFQEPQSQPQALLMKMMRYCHFGLTRKPLLLPGTPPGN